MRISNDIPIEDEDRPMCACGYKMELIEFEGYYDNFKFWECSECGEPDHLKAGDILRGQF